MNLQVMTSGHKTKVLAQARQTEMALSQIEDLRKGYHPDPTPARGCQHVCWGASKPAAFAQLRVVTCLQRCLQHLKLILCD